jgi:transposase-like protein
MGFANEAACAAYLFAARWPNGFVCPSCGKTKAWELQTKPWTYACAGCGKQTSVTAVTIMHHSKLPLTTWFWAAYLMATHPNGISALQLQRKLALRHRQDWRFGFRERFTGHERLPQYRGTYRSTGAGDGRWRKI